MAPAAGGRTKVWREGRKSSVYYWGLGSEIKRPGLLLDLDVFWGIIRARVG